MTPDGSLLVYSSPVSSQLRIHTADGFPLPVTQCGAINSTSDRRLTQTNVFHVPSSSLSSPLEPLLEVSIFFLFPISGIVVLAISHLRPSLSVFLVL